MTRKSISVTNTSVVNTETGCGLPRKIAESGTARPFTLSLANARRRRDRTVQALADDPNIELPYLPNPISILTTSSAAESSSACRDWRNRCRTSHPAARTIHQREMVRFG